MARMARVEVFAADEIAIVHVMNRTVRRCFLLGYDAVSGKNYDHRKIWIDDRLVHLARHFGIDLLCQSILSNHVHLVLRSRPDVVREWDDTEVARRWLMLCPPRRNKNRQPEEPTEAELNKIRRNRELLTEIRSRLSDISWWMRLFSQNIGQRANKEDDETGKFWQARFRAVRLLDETAVLACAAYVDLNPIRAAMAETIEDSHFTSAQKRARDLQTQLCQGFEAPSQLEDLFQTADAGQSVGTAGLAGDYLAPVQLLEHNGPTGADRNTEGRRCSNKGFLPMTTAEYLSLLDWTARQEQILEDVTVPSHVSPLLERLGIDGSIWHQLVRNFGKLFSIVAGRPQKIDGHCSRLKAHRYHVRRSARELFAAESSATAPQRNSV